MGPSYLKYLKRVQFFFVRTCLLSLIHHSGSGLQIFFFTYLKRNQTSTPSFVSSIFHKIVFTRKAMKCIYQNFHKSIVERKHLSSSTLLFIFLEYKRNQNLLNTNNTIYISYIQQPLQTITLQFSY